MKAIILPIKKEFVKKILNKEKKFEYRKRLCRDNVDKIYIYETSPTKKVVAEVEIIEKIIMNKEKMWEQTCNFSGINKEFYDNYFRNQKYACAYKLGNFLQYKEAKLLKEFGVDYYPQSFVYVDKINTFGEE